MMQLDLCLTHQDLDKLLKIDDEQGAILAIPAVDTIKRANKQQDIIKTEDRAELWLAQTPQFFRCDLLRNALEQGLLKVPILQMKPLRWNSLDFNRT